MKSYNSEMKKYSYKKNENDLPHKDYAKLQDLKNKLSKENENLKHLKEIQKWENEQKK